MSADDAFGRAGRADLAVLCGPEGEIRRVLSSTLVGPDVEEGATLLDVVDAGSRRKAERMLAEIRDRGAVFGWELAVPHRGEVRSMHFAAGRAGEGLLVVGASTPREMEVFYDEMMRLSNEQTNEVRALVKERARREEPGAPDPYIEMTRLNNELAQAQREMAKKNIELERLNDQKSQFLGMAAHDLRNPLGVILGYAELLLDTVGPGLAEGEREMLEVIHSSSEFMLGMVDELLDVSRIESGRLELKREPTDLRALLEHNVKLNSVLADRKEMTVVLRVEDPLPELDVDPGKIDQVLNNLVGNAVKYSHEGSRIEVRAARDGDAVLVEVEDEGQGIPEDELGKLFKPFSTTSATTTGGEESTGLGLMIVRRIVEGHGGAIGVESTLGEGTTFSVRLPVPGQDGEEGAGVRAEEEGSRAAEGPLSILLADDSRSLRTLIRALLEAEGHEVTAVEGGDAALAAAARDSFDVVLLDLEMPGRDGFETARALRGREEPGAHLPLLAVTGHDEEQVAADLAAAGFDGWVGKPIQPAELRRAVARAAALRRPASPR